MKTLIACLLGMFSITAVHAEAELWAALRDGRHVAVMRHELAPGVGDPEGFRIDDCSTQRNLSALGREQASATGERFRARGIAGQLCIQAAGVAAWTPPPCSGSVR